MESTYKNVSFFFLAILAVIVFGFFKTYFSLISEFQSINTAIHVHAISYLIWFAMLIIQPILIKKGKIDWHGQVGKLSYFLVPIIVLSTYLVAKNQLDNDLLKFPKFVALGTFITFNFLQLFLFVLFYILAIVNKKNSVYHVRYMIVTSLVLLDPGLARILIIWGGLPFIQGVLCNFVLTDLILVALIIYDWLKTKSIHKPYILSLAFLIITHLIWYYLPTTMFWKALCEKI